MSLKVQQGNFRTKRPVVSPPIFLKASDLPREIRNVEILKQAEVIAGTGRARIAQRIGGIWRLHMADQSSRLKVLEVGMTVKGRAIPTYDQNPNQYRDKDGNVIETTKLTIENLPVSISDEDLLSHLKDKGVEPTSELDWANCRSIDHTLIRNWYNGDRFIFIKKPVKPLPEFSFIGKFKIFLSHQEQLTEVPCSNCLQLGHRSRRCRNAVVCLDCKAKGHRKGHPACSLKNKKDENEKPANSQIITIDKDKEEGELSDDDLYQNIDSDSESEKGFTSSNEKVLDSSKVQAQSYAKVVTNLVPEFMLGGNNEENIEKKYKAT